MKKIILLTCLICLTVTVQISGADESQVKSANESSLPKIKEDEKDETKDTLSAVEDGKVVKKRQIYREQVLPHAGGKIPDTTFQTDRLILNRLQKEGIAVPDGVILEQRNPQVFPYYNRARRPVYKVQATQDGRYTPVEGRYVFDIPPGLETTYLYPQVHNHPLRYPPSIPIVPQYKHLTIPSPLATGEIKPSPISSPQSRKIYLVSYEVKPSIKASTASVLNIRNTPLTGFSLNQFPTDLITSQAHGSLFHPEAPERKRKEEEQDFSKIPGVPGVDYPLYHEVPHTNFHCGNVPALPGMYANVETGCQAYHVCHDGREGHQGAAFLCTNGTVFNQKEFACDWWYNVDCAAAPQFYHLNTDPEHNPFIPKKKPEEEHQEKLLIHV